MCHFDPRRSPAGGQRGKHGGSLRWVKSDSIRKQRSRKLFGKITSLALSYAALHKATTLIDKTSPQTQQQAAPAPVEKAPMAGEQQVPPAQQK